MSAFDTAIKEHREKAQSRRSFREQLQPVSQPSHDSHMINFMSIQSSWARLYAH